MGKEVRIIPILHIGNLPVHDHGLEHGSFPRHELDHPVDQRE